MRRHVVLAGACLLAVAGCGDDKKPQSDGQGRTLAIAANDQLRFDPDVITAKAGERITFVITNTGTVDHDFVIGNAAYLSGHGSSDEHEHGDDADEGGVSVAVPAGKKAEVTYEMPDQAPSFACFVNDHDLAGMKGTVSYS